MQTRYFKRLLPLTAVALLILAFLAIELEEPPGPCERRTVSEKEERRRELFQAQDRTSYLKYREITAQAKEVRPRYEAMFWRQPNVYATSIGFHVDEDGYDLEVPDGEGGCKKVVGFIIRVTEKVDQSAFPPEDRIPSMLEGVPVQIREEPSGLEW